MSNMKQNVCDKTNALLKMKNRAGYTLVYIHYLVWIILLEIINEIANNNPTARNSERKATTMRRKTGFDTGQQIQ